MVDLGVRAAAERPQAGAPRSRIITRHRALPGGRAVVGAFLVSVAVVGVFGSYLSATAEPDTVYAVAAVALDPGDVIEAADVQFLPLDLPDAMRARSIASEPELLGATVLHARRAGELVQVSDVVRSGGESGTREVSFAVEASRALGERILPGERIDLLATYGTGDSAYTVVVVRHALVLRAGTSTSPLVGDGQREFTIAVERGEDPLAVAHAVDVGQLTVVRATNSGNGDGPTVYRPPGGEQPVSGSRD